MRAGQVLEVLCKAAATAEPTERALHGPAWGQLKFMIGYKAARAGVDLREVDPRNTTQECSRCGALVRKALCDRVHACEHCGLTCDRDLNAACVILHRAVGRPADGNVTDCGERRPRNVSANEMTPYLQVRHGSRAVTCSAR